MITIDKNSPMPEIQNRIVEICDFLKNNRLYKGDSFFIEDFPLQHLTLLASALMGYHAAPVYMEADSIFGGRGVRVYPLTDIKFGTIEVSNVDSKLLDESDL